MGRTLKYKQKDVKKLIYLLDTTLFVINAKASGSLEKPEEPAINFLYLLKEHLKTMKVKLMCENE
jgi:hypothetical protein